MLEEIVKHIGRPLDTACTLIENILGPPTTKLGELLGDHVSYWQWANRLNIAEKAGKKLLAKGLLAHSLPMDFAIPLLREAGDIADDFLQNWWAELIASAIEDPTYAHIAFVNTLHSMSPSDVVFLDAILRTQHVGYEGRIEAVVAASSLTHAQALLSFHNLERLGFFTPTGKRFKGFAFDLLNACAGTQQAAESLKKKQMDLPHNVIRD